MLLAIFLLLMGLSLQQGCLYPANSSPVTLTNLSVVPSGCSRLSFFEPLDLYYCTGAQIKVALNADFTEFNRIINSALRDGYLYVEYTSNGRGSSEPLWASLNGSGPAYDVIATADLNGDLLPDAVYFDGALYFALLNELPIRIENSDISTYTSVVLGDVSGDGAVDIVAMDSSTGRIDIYVNDFLDNSWGQADPRIVSFSLWSSTTLSPLYAVPILPLLLIDADPARPGLEPLLASPTALHTFTFNNSALLPLETYPTPASASVYLARPLPCRAEITLLLASSILDTHTLHRFSFSNNFTEIATWTGSDRAVDVLLRATGNTTTSPVDALVVTSTRLLSGSAVANTTIASTSNTTSADFALAVAQDSEGFGVVGRFAWQYSGAAPGVGFMPLVSAFSCFFSIEYRVDGDGPCRFLLSGANPMAGLHFAGGRPAHGQQVELRGLAMSSHFHISAAPVDLTYRLYSFGATDLSDLHVLGRDCLGTRCSPYISDQLTFDPVDHESHVHFVLGPNAPRVDVTHTDGCDHDDDKSSYPTVRFTQLRWTPRSSSSLSPSPSPSPSSLLSHSPSSPSSPSSSISSFERHHDDAADNFGGVVSLVGLAPDPLNGTRGRGLASESFWGVVLLPARENRRVALSAAPLPFGALAELRWEYVGGDAEKVNLRVQRTEMDTALVMRFGVTRMLEGARHPAEIALEWEVDSSQHRLDQDSVEYHDHSVAHTFGGRGFALRVEPFVEMMCVYENDSFVPLRGLLGLQRVDTQRYLYSLVLHEPDLTDCALLETIVVVKARADQQCYDGEYEGKVVAWIVPIFVLFLCAAVFGFVALVMFCFIIIALLILIVLMLLLSTIGVAGGATGAKLFTMSNFDVKRDARFEGDDFNPTFVVSGVEEL